MTVGQAMTLPVAMKVSGVSETVTVTTATAGDRNVPDRGCDDAESDDDRDDPDSRTEVRRSADPHAGRRHRPGCRRRRDQLCRSARHLQQHQPRRRRLQQRVLRRAGRRTARIDRHHARRDQGVSGDRDRRAGRVRTDRRRRGQRHHQVRHQRAQGQPVLLSADGGADRRSVRRIEARRVSPRAVRRHARRSDQEGQGVLLSGDRRDQRQLRTAEPEPSARRRALPGAEPDGAAERGADQHDRRLPADGPARVLPVAAEPERRHPHRPSAADDGHPRQGRRRGQSEQQRLGIVELQSFAQDERDVRRGDLRTVGQRHRGRSGADQRDEPQLVHDALDADW